MLKMSVVLMKKDLIITIFLHYIEGDSLLSTEENVYDWLADLSKRKPELKSKINMLIRHLYQTTESDI